MYYFNHRFLLAMPLLGSWRVVLSANSTSTTVSANSSSLTTSTGSSATPSPSFTLYDDRDAFWFPLIGLSDDASVRWGVNVSTLDLVHVNGDVDPHFKVFEVVINDTNPVPSNAPELYNGPQVIAIDNDTIHQDGSIVITTNGDPTLVLGLNSNLNITTADFADDLIVPTVPFGLNYGHKGVWNGSIAVGSMYDANRVASPSWTLIAESAGGNSTFLQNGTLEITASLEFRGLITTFPTILDINRDAIILPSSYNCSQVVAENLIVGIPDPKLTDSMLKVVVPSNLTSTTDRCVTLKSHDPNNNKVILGRPFFQATYVYVDRDGHIFLTAAHQYDLDISAAKFEPNATLTPAQQPAQPADPSSSSTGEESAGAARMTGPSPVKTLGVGWSLTILTLVASLIAMNL